MMTSWRWKTVEFLKNHIVAVKPSIELSEKTNVTEAYYIKQLIADIKSNEQTKDKSIAVLTFFNEQAELLRRVIPDEDVKISIISIQGDERDIVVYSFVIKSPSSRFIALTGESGEIRKKSTKGRVNVAFNCCTFASSYSYVNSLQSMARGYLD